MAKIRVYELAREIGVQSKLLMNTLKVVGINVASHQSTLNDDQIELVKKAMKGEAATPQVGKPVVRSGSRVIRRRRKEEEPAEPVESPEVAAAASTDTEEQVAEPKKEEADLSAKAEEAVEIKPEAEVKEPSEEEAPSKAAEAVEAKAEVEKPAESSPRARKKKDSATIVRKASPEEVQRNQVDRSPRRGGLKKEDSRGTKYAGVGAAGKSEPTSMDPAALGAEPSTAPRRVADKDKRRDPDTKESRAKRLAVPKAKRTSSINTRLLVTQGEELEVTTAGVVPPRNKTVYRPNLAQKRRDLKRRKDLNKTEVTVARASYRIVKMGPTIQLSELAKQLKVKGAELVKKLIAQGEMITVNESVDFDTATLLSEEYNYQVISTERSLEDIVGKESVEAAASGEETRPPIVTVMGHVDHGKTSILDAIRKADVVSGEAGGITQHIGAYAISHNDKRIAFLDTPGHEAFSAMRARGADTTDIVVLVVAADDGVMPQTVEAISHAKNAGVPIIVAVNKIDKENKNIDRIYTELTEHGIQSEEWGGDSQFIKVSAINKIGIDELLEAILLQAEVNELRTSSSVPGDGVVVEAHLDQNRGPVATVMVRHGTFRTGDFVVAGFEVGKIRAMSDHKGIEQLEAGPSTPVEVLGLSSVPKAGDRVNVVKDEKTGKEVSEWRQENLNKAAGEKAGLGTLDELLGKMKEAELPELPLIIKADTQGSLEAVCDSLEKLNTDQVRNKTIHRAVGGISESDITLAEASGAAVIGFNVRAARGLPDLADERGVLISYFSVIYDLVDSVKSLMAGKLPPIVEEVVIGQAEVRQPINVPKIGTIAGSAVIDGKITRNAFLRLIRDEIVVYTGKMGSLRRFKDDVKEVKSGYECGISFENYNDIKIGDVIEAYEVIESRPTL